ncbi:hypothetical protein E2C01_064003 [Portunus trituberculatus]|uniref:Secreted protein n=1 Tax=Portunus trituberculatus TaxID=210409 RepID=A0A5B7HF56_PORTR|nr:hypothetical protein [Portunus trituberculatus]
MKIATSTSHALTLLAVVLLAATLLMDAAEARRGGHRPKTLIETFVSDETARRYPTERTLSSLFPIFG